MYLPDARPTRKIPPTMSATSHQTDSGSGITRAPRSITTPMMMALSTVPTPYLSRSGSQTTRMANEMMIDQTPTVRPNCSVSPWWRTSHGGRPSPDWSIEAMPRPKSTRPTRSWANRLRRFFPLTGMNMAARR